MYACQPVGAYFLQRFGQRYVLFFIGIVGNCRADKRLRRINKYAGWITIIIANNFTALRRLRFFSDAGLFHRFGIGPSGVAVHPRKPNRPFIHGFIQFSSRWEAPELPNYLIPSAAADPVSVRIIFSK